MLTASIPRPTFFWQQCAPWNHRRNLHCCWVAKITEQIKKLWNWDVHGYSKISWFIITFSSSIGHFGGILVFIHPWLGQPTTRLLSPFLFIRSMDIHISPYSWTNFVGKSSNFSWLSHLEPWNSTSHPSPSALRPPQSRTQVVFSVGLTTYSISEEVVLQGFWRRAPWNWSWEARNKTVVNPQGCSNPSKRSLFLC